MRFVRLRVENFKSLLAFEITLHPINILIGLNGAGKSTVLQFLDFLVQQMRGDLAGWLRERRWEGWELATRSLSPFPGRVQDPTEAGSSLLRAMTQGEEEKGMQAWLKAMNPSEEPPPLQPQIRFWANFVEGEENLSWEGRFDVERLQCTEEIVEGGGATLKVHQGQYQQKLRAGRKAEERQGEEIPESPIHFFYQGSILSVLQEGVLSPAMLRLKRFVGGAHPVELLSPEEMRQNTSEVRSSVGRRGKSLATFLSALAGEAKERIVERLQRIYPQVVSLETNARHTGQVQLELLEQFGEKQGRLEARHASDGLLRMIAMIAELWSETRLLLLDEMENGLHPEVMEALVESFFQSPAQVVATTHSPLLLNYLTDEQAKKSVIYLYRTKEGYTQAIPFFSIPSLQRKLDVMGPGEAFADTSLSRLAEEIEGLKGG